MDKIGKTHGMAFKMMPPRKAKIMPVSKDIVMRGLFVFFSRGKSNA